MSSFNGDEEVEFLFQREKQIMNMKNKEKEKKRQSKKKIGKKIINK